MEDKNQINPQDKIKEIIRGEYIKCSQSFPHFVKKYCWIQHPQKGRIPFGLFLFQEKVANLFTSEDSIYRMLIINKGRQLGISTLVAAYALWLMIFYKDKNVLVIATKQDTARNMIVKVRFMYDNLPSWLKIPATDNNKLSLGLKNGSVIKAVSAAADSGRSEAVSLLIIDEAAFIDDIDEIWPSAQKTLATGGKAIIISTPKGVGNWFHKNFTVAELGGFGPDGNGMTAIKLPWHLHPDRGEEYRRNEDVLLGPRMAAQENDCDFMTSGDTVIDPDILKYYESNFVCEPKEKRGVSHDLWIWEYADPKRSYIVSADVARGDDKDYSAFHVIDTHDLKQVAEFRCKVPTREFATILVSIAIEYNMALLVVENSSIGWDVINSIIEKGYPNLYYSPKVGTDLSAENYIGKMDTDKTTPGFTNSLKTRPLLVSKLKELMSNRNEITKELQPLFIIKSKRFLEELRTFVWNSSNRPEALKGYNDDLCMSGGIACYIRDIAIRFDQYNVDMARATVSGIVHTNNSIPNHLLHPLKGGRNPWQMQVGEQTHDLKWLLD